MERLASVTGARRRAWGGGLAFDIRDNAPGGARLTVAGDSIGIPQGDDELPFLEAPRIAEDDGLQVRRLDLQHRQVEPRISGLELGGVRLAIHPHEVIGRAMVAHNMAIRENQSLGVDDDAAAKLAGNKRSIGWLGTAEARNDGRGSVVRRYRLSRIAAHTGNRNNRVFGALNRLYDEPLHGGGGGKRGRFLGHRTAGQTGHSGNRQPGRQTKTSE